MTSLPTISLVTLAAIVVAGVVGLYLLMPHRHGGFKPVFTYALGALFSAIAVALTLSMLIAPVSPASAEGGFDIAGFLSKSFFYTFAAMSLIGGVLMITARDPVHSALWFAVVILSSSGLFLLAGAQFLAAGTVMVYAGAIIVTFLFVIMLAQSHGQALYDRTARRPLFASLTSFSLFGALAASLLIARGGTEASVSDRQLPSALGVVSQTNASTLSRLGLVVSQALPETTQLPQANESGKTPGHVAGLGGTLFTDHLITVEIVGLLLFVALIGAVAIATPRLPPRPGKQQISGPGSNQESVKSV